MLASGMYGQVTPGSPRERAAVIAYKEMQAEKLAHTRLMVSVGLQAEAKDVRKSYQDYISASNPHIEEGRKRSDERMKQQLKQEAERGAFWIEVERPEEKGVLKPRSTPRPKHRKARPDD